MVNKPSKQLLGIVEPKFKDRFTDSLVNVIVKQHKLFRNLPVETKRQWMHEILNQFAQKVNPVKEIETVE